MTLSENISELPALVLEETIILPQMTVGLDANEAAVGSAVENEGEILLLFALPGREDLSLKERVHPIGVVAELQSIQRGEHTLLVAQGLVRAELHEICQTEPFLRCTSQARPDPDEWDDETEELRREVMALIELFVELTPGLPDGVINFVRAIRKPGHLADNTAYAPEYSFEQRLQLLETFDVKERLKLVRTFFQERVAVARIQAQIRKQAREGLEESQRHYYLREQLKAIRQELGESDEFEREIEEYRRKIDATAMSEEACKEALRELSRMEKMPEQAAEFSVIKTYLDWLCDLPWQVVTADDLDISRARKVLDEDHYDLQEVKDRVLEYLAVRKLAEDRDLPALAPEDRRGAILCFVGPPGVGKTSLGRSIARALGRKFTRMSLGGMRDEAEIRGHRRTYIGAMPGRIMQAIRRAGTRNPVFMLDEVDKLGVDWRGDPSAALLEVLDPEQNTHYRDHYLDVDFDLSQVMFITTANLLEPVPAPLRDRMEILRLDGYIEPDKIAIARQYLVPRQIRANSLRAEELVFEDSGLRTLVRDYTREAGVRQLEREIGRTARKVATRIAAGDLVGPVTLAAEDIRQYLGKERFYFEAAERTETPGVVTGLAVTATGGDIQFIEATRMAGKGSLTLTGQLGDVLKESANLAMSYVRARAAAFHLDEAMFESIDLHVHIPAGSVPKDGPSAGVAIVAAIVSLLTRLPADGKVGMSGEITLRGRVLPVGGIKQKALAAHRAGLKSIILPRRNEADLEDLPEEVLEQITIELVDTIDEVLSRALPGLESRQG